MSYVAIARKWRPTSFEDISGQTHVTRTLQNAIRLNRIHHAYLFTGARGVGKTTAARVFARALNCAQGPTAEPCGECPSCLEVLSGSSPDVVEIDGASNNSVDDVRDLRETVRYLPQRGRKKIYIVDEVHMLSKGAFNALLKTLEEPPEHVVFLFATTEPNKIPETILSRVQRFDFKRIPIQVVVARLQKVCAAEGVQVSEDGLRLIARAGEGSMRDSQSLLDRVISFVGDQASVDQVAEVLGLVDRRLLYEMLEGMLRGEPDRCLSTIDQVHSFGYDLSDFTGELLELLRNATLVGLSPSSQRYLDVPEDEKERLRGVARDVGTDVFVRSFQVMVEVHDQVARSARPRIALEMAVARLAAIRPARPVDQIVDRLTDLERRLRHSGARPRAGGGPPGPSSPRGGDDDSEPHRGSSERGSQGLDGPSPPGAFRLRPPVEDFPEAPMPEEPPVALPPEEPVMLEEDATEGPGGPPLLPAQAPEAARHEAFAAWLRLGGMRYDELALETAIASVRPPQLSLYAPSPMKLNRLGGLVNDARVRQAAQACFPGCTVVRLELRPSDSPARSLAEQRRLERDERRKRVTAEIHERREPLVNKLCDRLGIPVARARVALPDETPPELKEQA